MSACRSRTSEYPQSWPGIAVRRTPVRRHDDVAADASAMRFCYDAAVKLVRNAMSPTQSTPAIRIAPNNPVFDLPVIVGIEEGTFAEAGLDVRFSATYADRERDHAGRPPPIMGRLKEQMFDCGSADSYNVCEWASIDRLERGRRSGNIAALRAAV